MALSEEVETAVAAGNPNLYMAALRRDADFMAAFPDGIPAEVEAGLLADFNADALRAEGGAGGFDLGNIGNVLSQIWDDISSGNFDFGNIISSIMGIFNFSADPQVAEFEATATAGQDAAMDLSDEAGLAYAEVVNARDGTPTPG